jgi:hypothetical protein
VTGGNDIEKVGGYDVPIDPLDDLQCESCQRTPMRKINAAS